MMHVSLGSVHLRLVETDLSRGIESLVWLCRSGRHIYRESVRLCQSAFLSNRLHSVRILSRAGSTPDQSSSAEHSSDHFNVRRQLQAGRKLSKVQIRGYKVGQLREALQEEGLSTKGLKAELVERLYELVQALSQESQDSNGPLDQSSAAEGPSQARHPSSSPEQPSKVASELLHAPDDLTALHDDATAFDSGSALNPNLASASDPQDSAHPASNSAGEAEPGLSSSAAANAQPRPACQETASAEAADVAAAAVPVGRAAQHGSRPPSCDLQMPDQVASKTGGRRCLGPNFRAILVV